MLVLLFCVALCECLVFCGVGVAVLSLCAPGVESWVCRQPGAICGVLAVFWVWLFKHEVVLQSSVAVVHHSISDVLCPWLHIRGDVTLRRHAKTSCEDIARRHPAKTSREDVTRGRHAGTSREGVSRGRHARTSRGDVTRGRHCDPIRVSYRLSIWVLWLLWKGVNELSGMWRLDFCFGVVYPGCLCWVSRLCGFWTIIWLLLITLWCLYFASVTFYLYYVPFCCCLPKYILFVCAIDVATELCFDNLLYYSLNAVHGNT